LAVGYLPARQSPQTTLSANHAGYDATSKAYVTLGITGLISGIAIGLLLVAIGVEIFTWNPLYMLLVFGFFGAIAGLLLGGFVALRPDHDRLITWVKTSARGGHWFVLVHARDHQEERRAKDALQALSGKVVGTL
jgi:hypothetical protein